MPGKNNSVSRIMAPMMLNTPAVLQMPAMAACLSSLTETALVDLLICQAIPANPNITISPIARSMNTLKMASGKRSFFDRATYHARSESPPTTPKAITLKNDPRKPSLRASLVDISRRMALARCCQRR